MIDVERWRAGTHEALHVVTAIGVNVQVVRVAIGNGGTTSIGPCDVNRRAFVAAAGLLDEEFVFECPEDLAIETDSGAPTERAVEAAGVLSQLATRPGGLMPGAMSDARHVALIAITNFESTPDVWQRRRNFFVHVAREVIADRLDDVRRLAIELYRKSILHENEITEILKGTNDADDQEAS